jgi:hypothetical protein
MRERHVRVALCQSCEDGGGCVFNVPKRASEEDARGLVSLGSFGTGLLCSRPHPYSSHYDYCYYNCRPLLFSGGRVAVLAASFTAACQELMRLLNGSTSQRRYCPTGGSGIQPRNFLREIFKEKLAAVRLHPPALN